MKLSKDQIRIASKKYLETQNAFGYKVYYKKDGKLCEGKILFLSKITAT